MCVRPYPYLSGSRFFGVAAVSFVDADVFDVVRVPFEFGRAWEVYAYLPHRKNGLYFLLEFRKHFSACPFFVKLTFSGCNSVGNL